MDMKRTGATISQEAAANRTPRIENMRERFFSAKPAISLVRDILFTKSFKETTGERMEGRRAKAFKYVMENIPITIQEDELIVGSPNPELRATGAYPELGADWVEKELDIFETRDQDPLVVSDETKKILREELIPYWRDKNQRRNTFMQLPEVAQGLIQRGELYINWFEYASGHISPTWEWLIPKGIASVKADAEEKLRNLSPLKYTDLKKIEFLKALLLVCDGIMTYARRYADKALEMAGQEKNPGRKKELEQIAEICNRVPAYPARTFQEALQFVYFVQVLAYVETKGQACAPGRLDQYTYPYYKKDLAEGRLTKEAAQELIDCLWVKLAEITNISSTMGAKFYPGYMPFQVVDIGGLDANGEDATNEISYMCLQAQRNVKLTQPSLVSIFSSKSPKEFYVASLETILSGTGGIPALVNADVGMKSMLRKKRNGVPVSLEDARGVAAHGCVAACVVGKQTGVEGGILNLASDLERALRNGVSRLSGLQIGPATGDARTFTSYEQLLDAVKKQIEFVQDTLFETTMIIWRAHEEDFPEHFESVLVEGCVEKATRAKSPIGSGSKYPTAIGFLASGLPTVANSLAAIKKLVFEEKRITMSQLLDALDADFVGYEDMRQMLVRDAPKYGNDDDYVDDIALDLHAWLEKSTDRYADEEGHHVGTDYNLISSHVPMGMLVGATPDGRKAGTPLADNLSPACGTDLNGPTAVMKTVAKYPPESQGGTLLNMKFDPKSIEGKNMDKFISLLKTYWDLGGYHVQLNTVGRETLLAAQKNPEEYRDLMVRIAGFSCYFTILDQANQNDIIERTTYTL